MNGGTEITLPGLTDLSASVYHQDAIDPATPSLSASLACTLITQTPAHAYLQHPRLNPDYITPEPKKAWDIGTVAHTLILEGYANVHVVEGVTDWRTKEARIEAETARENGKIPLLRHEWEQVAAMVDHARAELECWDIDPQPLTDGKPEVTVTWEEDGVLCRCRPDWLHDSYAVIEDVKTSRDANPETFARKTVPAYGYDLRAAMYLRGVKAVTGVDARWRWIVVEKEPPYVVTIVEPSDAMLAVGAAKLDRALTIWRECLESGVWPAFGRDVFVAEPAGWEMRWLDNSEEYEEAAWELI